MILIDTSAWLFALKKDFHSDKALWDLSSKLSFDLRRKGIGIPYADIVIAASAVKEKAILVHADSHFDSIADHTDLRVESFVSLINK